MKTLLANKIRQIDYYFNNAYLRLVGEKKSLIIFLFHVLFRDEKEKQLNIIHPRQGITLSNFQKFIDYYSANDYIFVSPEDILKGLDDGRNYAMITFDDGYYNNIHSLPILNKYRIPALFFISTDCVTNNKAFLWDVLYREKSKLGVPVQTIFNEINTLKSTMSNRGIEEVMFEKFGSKSFVPFGDIDRPFTPSELKDFSGNKFVFLGNHTSEHAFLAICNPDEIRATIEKAQDALHQFTGIYSQYISYPDGSYSSDVIRIVKEMGFKLGMAVDYRKNYLPIDFLKDEHLQLSRFALGENGNIINQCQLCRTDIRITKVIKKLIGKA